MLCCMTENLMAQTVHPSLIPMATMLFWMKTWFFGIGIAQIHHLDVIEPYHAHDLMQLLLLGHQLSNQKCLNIKFNIEAPRLAYSETPTTRLKLTEIGWKISLPSEPASSSENLGKPLDAIEDAALSSSSQEGGAREAEYALFTTARPYIEATMTAESWFDMLPRPEVTMMMWGYKLMVITFRVGSTVW